MIVIPDLIGDLPPSLPPFRQMPTAPAEPPLPYARPPTAQANGHRLTHTGPAAVACKTRIRSRLLVPKTAKFGTNPRSKTRVRSDFRLFRYHPRNK